MDVIELEPGASTTFRVPPRGAVRVVRIDGKLAAGDVQIWVSNGSGLYRHLVSGINREDGSIVAVPDQSTPSLARVVRDASCRGSMRVAVFTSRLLEADFLDGYWCRVRGCGDAHDLSDGRLGAREPTKYWALTSERIAAVDVTGPARLEIATRYLYAPEDSVLLQPYRIYAHPSSGARQVLEFEATPEERRHTHIDLCERLVGSRELAYLDVPAGKHTLEFSSSSRLMMQVKKLTCKIYGSRKFNSPCYFPRQARGIQRPDTASSIWKIPQTDVARFLRFDPSDATAQAGLALRSVRDNRFQQGGLRATMMVMSAAAGRPGEPTVRQFAESLRLSRTQYRTLLPQWQDQNVLPKPAYFTQRSLRRNNDDRIDSIVGEQIVGNVLSNVPLGNFIPVGSCWANAGLYALPQNLGPSYLRIAIDESTLSAKTRLLVQFDERDPILLDAMPECELKLGNFKPTRAETALASLNHMHPEFDSGTLGGPFAQHNDPAPLVSAGTTELLIPPAVRTVRVWATGQVPRRPAVALQYRTSKTYRLTESAYLDAVQRADLPSADFFDAMLNEHVPACRDPYAFQELRNHWVGLVRTLREKHRKVLSRIELPVEPRSFGAEQVASDGDLEAAETARQMAAHDQWLPALETWSPLVNSAQESLRREATLQRAACLVALHEVSLAKTELMGTYFSNPNDRLLKQLAYDAIIDLLVRQEDLGGLESFLAAAVVQQPTKQNLHDLVDALVAQGRHRQAVLIGLMTGEWKPISESMLRATYQEGWWRTFDHIAADLPAAQASLWMALKQMKRGRMAEAMKGWEAAGQYGEVWLNHLRTGEQILNKLSETDATKRACAVHAWEAWQAHHPGPRTWREEGALVAECPGTASVYSVGRDVYGQYFAADPGNPLQLIVHGPVDLKLSVRPVHGSAVIEPLNDWLSIESKDAAAIVPITANRIDLDQQIVGNESAELGKPVDAFYRVGPGRHEISVSAEQSRTLVRVFASRPEMPLPVLPAINESTLAAICTGDFRRPQLLKFNWKRHLLHPRHSMVAHLLPVGCNEAVHLPFLQFGPFTSRPSCPEIARQQNCSSDCTLCDHDFAQYATEPACGTAHLLADASCTADSLAAGDHSMPSLPAAYGWTNYEESPSRIQGQHLAAADLLGALRVPCERDWAAVRQKMWLLAYVAEKNRSETKACYASATQLLLEHPGCPDIASARSRISKAASWKLWREFDASGGVHTLEIGSWMPELPSLRTRRAMLATKPISDALLTGSQELALDVRNTEETQFTIQLQRPQVGYLVGGPMRVVCQVGGRPEEIVELMEGGATQQLQLALPKGQHRIRLWHADPYLDHFALVTVVERREQLLQVSAAPSYTVSKRNRVYQVATHDEPIRFRVPGPATLRIDELRSGRTFSMIEVVEEGSREFVLRPIAGEELAFYRIMELQYDARRVQLTSHQTDIEPAPVPQSWLENGALAGGSVWPIDVDSPAWFAPGKFVPGCEAWGDPLALMSLLPPDGKAVWLELDSKWKLGQEDGTKAYHFGKYARRALEEADRVGLPDRFSEAGMTHYEYDPWNDKHWKTERFTRTRDSGGRSAGYTKAVRFTLPPRWTWVPRQLTGIWGSRDPWVKRYPVDVTLTGKGFAQLVDSVVPRLDGDLEWGALGSARISRRRRLADHVHHVPSATVFRRIMSLEFNSFAPGEIDQDVYTEFKNDHRFGYIFSDRLVWQRKVDRRWWAEPSFYSNEDFRMDRPDHMSVRVGHSRLTGPLYLDGSYRYARYFRDSDRDEYATQHLVYLQSRLGGWLDAGNRIELASGISHDITGERTSAYMNLIWYRSRGRGNTDFHGNDMPFLPVQTQNALPAWFGAGPFGRN